MDGEERSFCEAAGALGLDPYAIDDLSAEFIERAGALFDGEALMEFLAGTRKVQAAPLLQWIGYAEARPAYKSRIGKLGDIGHDAARSEPVRSGERSWSLGYRRARAARTCLDLKANHRFSTYSQLARLLGASPGFELAQPIDGIRALRSDQVDGVHIHVRKVGHGAAAAPAHLFALARGVGDAVCFPDPVRMPVNELHSAYRQAAGRAFAAEFLAPIDEVQAMQADGHDQISIAEEFGVSLAVVEHQLQNADRIAEACA
jgi:hypothetical protein